MNVIKRDGSREPLNIEQIRKQTIEACKDLENTSYEELELACKLSFVDNMPTKDIQAILIQTAAKKIDIDTPNYTYVAARLSLYDLYHRVKHLHNSNKQDDVYDVVTLQLHIDKNKDILSDWHSKYTKDDIEELNRYIEPTRDLLFDYPGFSLLEDIYLLKVNGISSELPQHMHMSLAMFIMQNEQYDRLSKVKQHYDLLSKLKFINPTPINANGRVKDGGLISCLLTTVADSLDGIMDKGKEIAAGSKIGSGWGVDFSRVRSIGSNIGIHKSVAGGKIPFLKIFNDISVAFNQLGKRPGAVAVYIECWDIEIFDFIDLRKTSGDENRRAHSLFLAISYNDLFMERESKDGDWILFDPKDVPMLTETFGEEFRKHYLRYEEFYLKDPTKFNKNTRVVKARDIMRAHCISYSSIGFPFVFFKDTVNERHLFKDFNGIIRSSNLCTEVTLPVTDELTGVCNLGSVNLARMESLEDLQATVKLAVRAMDNAIDLTAYPSIESENFQKKYRSIGLGSLGEAEMLANNKIHYGSDEHKVEIDKIWKTISETANETSMELAKEKGSVISIGDMSYRNAYLMAIAPNSSSAIFAGTTNGIEPVYNTIWVEENKRGSFLVTAPHLSIDNMEYYKNPYEIDIFKQLEVNAIRQKYVDMAISQNLFLDPDGLGVKHIRNCIVYAWELKLKTLYYLRSKPPKGASNFEIDIKSEKSSISCIGCAN